jgi:hypothetical protein
MQQSDALSGVRAVHVFLVRRQQIHALAQVKTTYETDAPRHKARLIA